MVSEAEAAGIYPIVCTIPLWDVGPLATQIDAQDPENYERRYNVGSFNFALLELSDLEYPANSAPVGFADLYALLTGTSNDPNPWWMFESEDDVEYFYDAAYTTDGVNPDPAAPALMVNLVQGLITDSKHVANSY